MNNHLDEKLIQEILRKGTEIKAPKDLGLRILKRWHLESLNSPNSIPVIPGFIWWLLAFFLTGLFIWGFSKMTFSSNNSELITMVQHVLDKIGLYIEDLKGIVFPSLVVLMTIVLINVLLLKNRFLQQRVFG